MLWVAHDDLDKLDVADVETSAGQARSTDFSPTRHPSETAACLGIDLVGSQFHDHPNQFGNGTRLHLPHYASAAILD
jgi:hypothetical protein